MSDELSLFKNNVSQCKNCLTYHEDTDLRDVYGIVMCPMCRENYFTEQSQYIDEVLERLGL